MNKHDFISLVESPQTLGKQHITSLRSVAADFPYFQTAQVLLAKALYNEKHYEFEKQLKHVSLMSPDRAVLFRFIHNLHAEPVEVPAPTVVESVLETPQNHTIEETVEDEVIPEPIVQEPILEQLVEIPQALEVIESVESIVETPVFDESIEVVTETPVAKIPVEEESSSNDASIHVDKPETTVSSSETHSFAEWLLLQQQAKIVEEASLPQTPVIIEPELTPEPQETPSMQEEIAKQVERSNVNEFESILDKFIRENPRISRAKAEFYNPVNMAKQSVEEDEELATETLAKVYYNQGHYKKAIRVYEKLCLIYPHKMSYFASLIQKIKTENKD